MSRFPCFNSIEFAFQVIVTIKRLKHTIKIVLPLNGQKRSKVYTAHLEDSFNKGFITPFYNLELLDSS